MVISNGVDKQVIIKDLLISYTETGEGGAKTLLFLHGWRSSKEVWTGIIKKIISAVRLRPLLARQLAGHPPHAWGGGKWNVYALDLPGFGGSQTPPSPPSARGGISSGWTVGDYADVAAEFIRKLDLRQVEVIGHSFGGRVGIKLAAAHPELVSKLVLVDSAGFSMPFKRKSLYNLVAKIAKPFFIPKIMAGARKKIYRKIGAEDYVATPALQKTFVNIVGEDLSFDMGKIRCPTLIINGENDKDTPMEFGQRMNSLIPHSKFLILNNAGHFSFLDQPEKFTEVLGKFISE
jgi:pimeloyl-ACP methyl ester carboxylesterase